MSIVHKLLALIHATIKCQYGTENLLRETGHVRVTLP